MPTPPSPPRASDEQCNSFIATIRESNRQGRDAWARFAAHRARVTETLTTIATEHSSLGLLGAGNLNDVELEQLLEVFAEVHLVDLDVEAVQSALARHGLERNSAVSVHGPIDLTGILDRLSTIAREDAAAVIGELVAALAKHSCDLPAERFDVTASAGVLTQLLQPVVDSALPSDGVTRVSLAVRDKHLRDLVRLTCPGGMLILVSDFVSTTTAPQLLSMAAGEFENEMAALVSARNFFTGTNPYRILALLEVDARYRREVTDVRLLHPWLWAVTADRLHLTYAIVARRRRKLLRDQAKRSALGP
jgi:hypothetical protein